MKRFFMGIVVATLSIILLPSLSSAISYNKATGHWEGWEDARFGADASIYTEQTLCYRSGTYSIETEPGCYSDTKYICTQGRDSNGNLVPISDSCLKPFVNKLGAKVKYSYYKKNEKGKILGTDDPSEAYTIKELEDPDDPLGFGYSVYSRLFDAEGNQRVLYLQPIVTVKIPLRIDWKENFKLLELTNKERVEAGGKPLVMDKNLAEAALYRCAELSLMMEHYSPWNGNESTDTVKRKFPIFRNTNLDENVGGMSNDLSFAKEVHYTPTDGGVEYLGYKNSHPHHYNYMKPEWAQIGTVCASNANGHTYSVELFMNDSSIAVPITLEEKLNEFEDGIEYRTVEVPILKEGFDYELANAITSLEEGSKTKLAWYAHPVDYYLCHTIFTKETAMDGWYLNHQPFAFNSLTFCSSDESIATVNSEGMVTALKPGTVIITTSLDGIEHSYPVTVNYKAHTIGYNLGGGKNPGNVTSFTENTPTFTLKNPTRDGYTFLGWTGSNGTSAQTTVIVAKGTTLNLTYTANWKKKKVVIDKSYSIKIISNRIKETKTTQITYKFKKGDRVQYYVKGKWRTLKTMRKSCKSYSTTHKEKLRVQHKKKKKWKTQKVKTRSSYKADLYFNYFKQNGKSVETITSSGVLYYELTNVKKGSTLQISWYNYDGKEVWFNLRKFGRNYTVVRTHTQTDNVRIVK